MSRKTTFHWQVITVLALLFTLLCTTCSLGGGTEPPERVSDLIHAKEPLITVQPAVGLALKTDGSITTQLSVTAEPQDGGVLSYQWVAYADPADDGTPAGTGQSFSPPLNEGVFYYAVVVTNTLEEATGNKTAAVKSDLAIVTVSDPTNAEYPGITALSGDGYYIAGGAGVTLEVTAAVTDGGILSYKWFSSESAAIADGTELSGETGETYTLPNTAAGTYYYYVEVTNTNNAAPNRKASVTVTTFPVTVVAANATFTVNTATTYQYVRGFGGMYTPWDNAPQESVADFERMFNPDSLGMNILRIMILPHSTDIEDTMLQITTGRDGDGKDQSMYYDIVKLVNKYNGYVLAAPWSPPAAWKTNDSVNGGGALKTQNYKNFANYLKKFCEVMYNNGAPIYAVSLQNEPTFKATYDGCEYSTIEHRNWWQTAGGAVVEGDVRPFTYGVKGWGGGKEIPRVLTMTGEAHNNVSPFHTDATAALQTADARQFIDLVGIHNYGRGINPLADNQRHGKEVWMTEHNINSGAGSYQNDSTWNYVWKFMNDVDLNMRFNNDNAFIWWTAKRFYSMIGDGQEGTTNGNILPRGWGMAHYAKFAKETTRVAVTGSGQTAGGVAVGSSNFNGSSHSVDSTDVKVTAYKSADGREISLVMYTPTDPMGGGGVDMGTVRIKLPDGFIVGRATALRSNSAAQGVTESVIICADKNSAIVTLPASAIVSVKFTGAN